MKKSVAIVIILVFFALFLYSSHNYKVITGAQTIDLPEPPPPPGMESDQITPPAEPPKNITKPTPTSDLKAVMDRLDAIDDRLRGMDGWELRLNNLEAQLKIASDMSARMDAMQSQIDGMKVDIENLKQRPSFEAPFFDQLAKLEGSARKNAILSISLSVLSLVIIIGMVAATLVERRKEYLTDKKLLKQYLVNYQKAGYRMETLRMHLRANGWSDEFIDEVMREMPK